MAATTKLASSIPGISTVQTPDKVDKDGEVTPGTIFFVGTECEHWALPDGPTGDITDCRYGCLAKAAR
jgi:hypothetical protein